MDYSIETPLLEKLHSDCIIVGIYESGHLTPSAENLDELTNGIVTQIIERGDIMGKLGNVTD